MLIGELVKGNESGASEVVDATLIIVLGLALAGIVAAYVFGIFIPVEKNAYLVPQFGVVNISDHQIITVFDRGGEIVYLNSSSAAGHKAVLYVDTVSGSFRAVPEPSLTVFRPGDTIYAYYTGSGFTLTNTLTGVTPASLPAGPVAVRFLDVTSGVIIAKEDLIGGATTVTSTTLTIATPTATVTVIPTATVTTTTTATTVVTTTVTTTATAPSTPNPTATATTVVTTTPIPTPLVANFNWAESGSSGNVRFTDTSTGNPTSWAWNFGDGATSTVQNPAHKFTKGASYDTVFTVRRISDGAVSSTTKRITV